MHVKVSY